MKNHTAPHVVSAAKAGNPMPLDTGDPRSPHVPAQRDVGRKSAGIIRLDASARKGAASLTGRRYIERAYIMCSNPEKLRG